jgi:lipopolysaccharide export system protein LptC
MRHFSSGLLPLVLLTLLAALTFWLERTSQVEDARREGKLRHDPDFIVDHFTVQRFDLKGGLQYVLTATKMLHYPDDESTDVTGPTLVYYGGSRPAQISARRASISKDGKEIVLFDDVRMVSAASKATPEFVVTTSQMHFFPDDDVARGKMPVTITQGATVIKGDGFIADRRTQTVKLIGRVRGIIAPQHTKTP